MKTNVMEKRTKAAGMIGQRVDLDVQTKAISINEEKHTAIFIMSTASPDRHGDIVDQKSWITKHFDANAPFFWGHQSNEFPLGKWLKVWLEDDPEIEGEKMLVGEAEFAVDVHPDIERAWKHVLRGDLNMVSVGFIPHIVDYDEDKDAFVLKSCELLECSLVGIGANRRALVKNEDTKQALINIKTDIEKSITDADPAVNRKRNAIAMLNKAIRAYAKSEQ